MKEKNQDPIQLDLKSPFCGILLGASLYCVAILQKPVYFAQIATH